MVHKSITSWPQTLRARVKLKGSLSDLRGRTPRWIGTLEALDDEHCALSVGGDCPETLVGLLLYAGTDFTLLDPPEAATPIREIAERLLRAIR